MLFEKTVRLGGGLTGGNIMSSNATETKVNQLYECISKAVLVPSSQETQTKHVKGGETTTPERLTVSGVIERRIGPTRLTVRFCPTE